MSVHKRGKQHLSQRLRRYLITDPAVSGVDSLVHRVESALDGGMTAVQLRLKGWPDRQIYEAAICVRHLTEQRGALFLINDRVDIARACQADGVHLGVEDLPASVARASLGDDAVIGYSPEGDEDLQEALEAGVDYLGVGPVYGTLTKADAGEPIGLDGLRRVVESVSVPVVGIGGITAERAADVVATGAVGVAIVRSVFLADEPGHAAEQLREALP